MVVINELLQTSKCLNLIGFTRGLAGKTFVIQGLGRCGTKIALSLVKSGAKCVGVKEIDAFVYDANGVQLEVRIFFFKY